MSWTEAKPAFIADGTLRDIYILDADLSVWRQVWDFLRCSEYRLTYSVDGVPSRLPDDVRDALAARLGASPLLRADLGGVALNCHFFRAEEVEFDLHPRDVNTAERYAYLLRFIRGLGQHVGQPVILTPENGPEMPLLRYDPEDDGFAMPAQEIT